MRDNPLHQQLLRSLHSLGMSPVLVEPEVEAKTLQRIRCKTLADMIAHLINENEPCLRAAADGATVIVRDGDGLLRFTVETV